MMTTYLQKTRFFWSMIAGVLLLSLLCWSLTHGGVPFISTTSSDNSEMIRLDMMNGNNNSFPPGSGSQEQGPEFDSNNRTGNQIKPERPFSGDQMPTLSGGENQMQRPTLSGNEIPPIRGTRDQIQGTSTS